MSRFRLKLQGVLVPRITSQTSFTVNENSVFSTTLTSSLSNTVWSLDGGADVSLFSLVSDQLSLPEKDYEDLTHGTSYVVKVRATNPDNGKYNVATITVSIANVSETVGTPANILS